MFLHIFVLILMLKNLIFRDSGTVLLSVKPSSNQDEKTVPTSCISTVPGFSLCCVTVV